MLDCTGNTKQGLLQINYKAITGNVLKNILKVANADDALALSLCFAAASITVALVGGVIQLSEGGRLLASLDGADNASDDGPVTNDGG